MRLLGSNYRKLVAASGISNAGDGVSQIAYPWLASVVTRNPLLIALIAVAQRLPWLLFTLPAGVLTDRTDRRILMIAANGARALLTLVVASAVLGLGGDLPGVDQLDRVLATDWVLYSMLLAATLLLGIGEVIHDNAAQTFMPSIVDHEDLERANGRLYATELVANQFVGPPLGGLLLAAGFAVPFFVDAGTFAVAAALIALIAPAARSARVAEPRQPWRTEMREGIAWLWRHRFLRDLAVTLGTMNLLSAVTTAAFVLFAQEVLDTSTTEYAMLTIVSAVGGLVGGWVSAPFVARIGTPKVLRLAMLTFAAVSILVGLTSWWPVVALLLTLEYFAVVMWNVVTVSLRQAIIPDALLGRVNSVYRFVAWGAMPIGAVLGGAVVAVAGRFTTRETALRLPWWIAGAVYAVVVVVFALPRLTSASVEAARADAAGARNSDPPGR